ncbi:class I SAM-dependent methyltransferase [Sphingomonas sp. M1-B02]|uniref:class I SAM-dependent methyltransferase n=1 Tax=Sphingomonas sp. M1-B02 TaxID=3114300 RepID=UPI00224080EE|nr:class I SAM-dependent methyltransferase [Sphingomonas sp. S6-11]UZK65055.1 class I SAM-dependent methyltransferase [Sphingomonas sp. S6-11]
MNCRHCHAPVDLQLIDLGTSPPSNSYVTTETLSAPERWYPLRVLTCTNCWLVQTEDFADRSEFFSADYAYFSSVSESWLDHSRRYVEAMAERFDLGEKSLIVEVASNDGYLLQYAKARGIPTLGVEPTHSTAVAAREKGIEVLEEFFGTALAEQLAAEGRSADLTAANNVLAHVPDINDFVSGFATLLKPAGVATFEFPHLLSLIDGAQFDTIYHEHYSYLSLTTVRRIFAANGLTVFDVEQIPTHGGSLRVYAQRSDSGVRAIEASVGALLAVEREKGVETPDYYTQLQSQAETIAADLLVFLTEARSAGKTIAAYGAAAKGNTLLNFAGVRPFLLPYVVDRNPAKAGKYMPGSRIPIVGEDCLRRDRPDYVLILPWNLRDELDRQLAYVREWGGRIVTAVPSLSVA